MSCYECTIKEGKIELLEHNDGKWLSKNELDTIKWIPADITIVNYLKKHSQIKGIRKWIMIHIY